MLERGVAWLKSYQAEQVQLLQNGASEVKPYKKYADNLDALVFMVLVDAGVRNDDMLDFLYRDRTQLAVYAKAMFGLALQKHGEKDKLAMILQNIDQYVVQDDENQTAYLKLPDENYWWYWYGSEIEANAYYLKLLARTDPKGELALAAGQVPAQQPQARHLLEHDPRHGHLHRGAGRVPQGQRRGPARHDGRDLARRQEAQGGEDHAGRTCSRFDNAFVLDGDARRDGQAHGRVHASRARARSTSTPT